MCSELALGNLYRSIYKVRSRRFKTVTRGMFNVDGLENYLTNFFCSYMQWHAV